MRLLSSIQKEEELEKVAQGLMGGFKNNRVFVFSGALGSGKTTFIKYICKVLGVKSGISSPTFSLVNEYEGAHGSVVYHFDFYRIKDIQEAYDIGYEEYFYSGNYCFIEWPEKIPGLLPLDAMKIKIEIKNDGTREIWVM
jgi:tRNA threonylcarbamoyladenosine biosynthesis protein TsaE